MTGTTIQTELSTFNELETIIETYVNSWREAARAFRMIRDGRFKEMGGIKPGNPKYDALMTKITGYPSLEAYWPGRWNLTQRYVNKLIKDVEIADDVGSGPNGPEGIKRQAFRPMHSIPKADRKDVFEQAKKKAGGGKVNSRHVKEAVDDYEGKVPGDLENYARNLIQAIHDFMPDNAMFEQFVDELSNLDYDIREKLLNSTNVLIEELQNFKHQIEEANEKKSK